MQPRYLIHPGLYDVVMDDPTEEDIARTGDGVYVYMLVMSPSRGWFTTTFDAVPPLFARSCIEHFLSNDQRGWCWPELREKFTEFLTTLEEFPSRIRAAAAANRALTEPEVGVQESEASVPEAPAPARRKPGRPKKAVPTQPDAPGVPEAAAPARRKPGRPKKGTTAPLVDGVV